MNEIIKNIEAAQLKETVPSFNVGDTVRVSAKIKPYFASIPLEIPDPFPIAPPVPKARGAF